MKILNLILIPVILSTICYGKVAPDFPEPHHYFDSNIHYSNEISHIFNGRKTKPQEKIGVSIAHQNREWEYNWFLFGMVVPVYNNHIVSFGYSNYGTNGIPITTADQVGVSISHYDADTFESIYLSYLPDLEFINLEILLNYKLRRLIAQKASATNLDFHLSSSYIFNNQLGLRSRNIIGTKYKWNHGTNEDLAKYIGIYFIQPISIFSFLVEYDACLNYNDQSTAMAQLSMQLDKTISIFSSYRISTDFSSFTIGSNLKLSDVFELMYANQNEYNDNQDLSIHTISIGVKF